MTPIPPNAPQRDVIRSIVPAQFHAKTWIAGSAATHWGQNADIDVWVTELTKTEMAYIFASLRDRELQSDPIDIEEGYVLNSLLVYNRDGIQVLVSEMNIASILEGFDIVCHAAAVPLNDSGGRVAVMHERFNPDIIYPLYVRDAEKTLRRMFRFAARYNNWSWMSIQAEAVQELAIDAFRIPAVTTEQYYRMRSIDRGF